MINIRWMFETTLAKKESHFQHHMKSSQKIHPIWNKTLSSISSSDFSKTLKIVEREKTSSASTWQQIFQTQNEFHPNNFYLYVSIIQKEAPPNGVPFQALEPLSKVIPTSKKKTKIQEGISKESNKLRSSPSSPDYSAINGIRTKCPEDPGVIVVPKEASFAYRALSLLKDLPSMAGGIFSFIGLFQRSIIHNPSFPDWGFGILLSQSFDCLHM
ncbi:hypothetical protein CEXT_702961 [Caerostris extrusa]|uniref:Uncharacterized protein n=1 Tax=Caerostris extrusa TaxID=172846 RepID=A0AAV4WBM2_CAEEX|nr:hypothetical protein CEXT_702961 [Caerostris extrusa]